MAETLDPTLWAPYYDKKAISQLHSRQIVGISTTIPINAAEIIKYEAANRDMNVTALVSKLLEIIAIDDLFAAILDQ